MASAWLDAKLEDYERHVALDTVGQAAAIRQVIAASIAQFTPSRFLYLGCAGGNGLEAIAGSSVDQVFAADLNANYLIEAAKRWSHLPAISFVQCDLNCTLPDVSDIDLIFGALVFEYLDPLPNLRPLMRPGGHWVALLLATRENAPAVAASPYREALLAVGSEFRYLSPQAFTANAAANGFTLIHQREIPLPAGKYFINLTFQAI